MPKIDIINYITKNLIVVFLFALLIVKKNSTMGNISIFENLNIHQIRLSKEDLQFNNFFTIWWGDLKTEI